MGGYVQNYFLAFNFLTKIGQHISPRLYSSVFVRIKQMKYNMLNIELWRSR